MKRLRHASTAMFIAVLAVVVGGQTASAAVTSVSSARLKSLGYQIGLLSEKEAKPFLGVTGSTPKEDPLSVGSYLVHICGQTVRTQGGSVAGRLVEYHPSANTYLQNSAVAFNRASSAKSFIRRVAHLVAGCQQVYSYPNSPSANYLPGTQAPKLPRVGDQRVADTAVVTDSQSSANIVHVAVRNGQFVNFTYMINGAAITPKVIESVATAMGARLTKLQKAAAKKVPVTHPKKFAKLTCTDLLTSAQLRTAFGVAFQEPSSCSFALAQGAGGVDITFTAAASGGRDVYDRLASGQPVKVNGAADALYKTEQNPFGQTTETVNVLTKNGDTFSISLRGDDAPKNQRAQLTTAATAAMKRLHVKA